MTFDKAKEQQLLRKKKHEKLKAQKAARDLLLEQKRLKYEKADGKKIPKKDKIVA